MSAVPGRAPDWLLTTVTAVRELMIKRLEAAAADPEAKREMEMALEELDVMWEELQGQAALLTARTSATRSSSSTRPTLTSSPTPAAACAK